MDLPPWLRPLAEAVRDGNGLGELPAVLVPEDGVGRASAVLIALGETDRGPSVLLIQRAATLRRHAGQAAFPGGAVDPTDEHHLAAALREAQEEVGLDPASVRPVAELPPLYIPRSGFLVTPIIAWWERPHDVFAVNPDEVARVAVVPLAELADPANRFVVRHPSGLVGPGFDADGLFVWGFTAALLDRLLSVGGWAQPWDSGVVRPLPAQLSGRPRAPER
jgi:8-oxo-dGTP pyrophosphatase MutT (NUDIX family)